MDYRKKLDELKKSFNGFDYEKYSQASDFDLCVIILRSNGANYGEISKLLGSPSKKQIRKSLLSWAPELIKKDCNTHKLESNRATKEEWILINFMKRNNRYSFDIGNEIWTFFDKEGKLYYSSNRCNYQSPFIAWDPVCRIQILHEIIDA